MNSPRSVPGHYDPVGAIELEARSRASVEYSRHRGAVETEACCIPHSHRHHLEVVEESLRLSRLGRTDIALPGGADETDSIYLDGIF